MSEPGYLHPCNQAAGSSVDQPEAAIWIKPHQTSGHFARIVAVVDAAGWHPRLDTPPGQHHHGVCRVSRRMMVKPESQGVDHQFRMLNIYSNDRLEKRGKLGGRHLVLEWWMAGKACGTLCSYRPRTHKVRQKLFVDVRRSFPL